MVNIQQVILRVTTEVLMTNIFNQLYSLALAFVVFAILPASFWGSLAYWVISPKAGTAVTIVFVLAGLYTCYRGSQNRYHWFKHE